MLRWASSTITRSKCPLENVLVLSSSLTASITLIIVWYVENTHLAWTSALDPQRLVDDIEGSRSTNASYAWDTSAVRSARNRMFLTHPFLSMTSTSDITVRVLPLPVAMTMRAFL